MSYSQHVFMYIILVNSDENTNRATANKNCIYVNRSEFYFLFLNYKITKKHHSYRRVQEVVVLMLLLSSLESRQCCCYYSLGSNLGPVFVVDLLTKI